MFRGVKDTFAAQIIRFARWRTYAEFGHSLGWKDDEMKWQWMFKNIKFPMKIQNKSEWIRGVPRELQKHVTFNEKIPTLQQMGRIKRKHNKNTKNDKNNKNNKNKRRKQ